MSDTKRLVAERDAAAGPLVVSATNPRYFAIRADNGPDSPIVYLTSHIWNNFHDGLGPGRDCADTPEQNDFGAYLEFLRRHGHNFIRLWRWEQFRSQAAGRSFHLCITPQPWPRTGPGTATDGRPKFDLTTFDHAFFDRLRDRVIAAGNAGIYVAVMFFEGWGPPPQSRARQRRGPPVPCREQRQRNRDQLYRRLPSASARPARKGAPGGVHPQGR
jgi:hypothetical protein